MDIDLVAHATPIAAGSPNASPASVMRVGTDLELSLASSGPLEAVAQRVTEIAGEWGCDSITGASPIGDRIAGAAVAQAKNGLRLFAPGLSGSHVLVIDGVLASGMQLSRKAQAIKKAGVPRTSAVVVVRVVEPTSQLSEAFDHIAALTQL